MIGSWARCRRARTLPGAKQTVSICSQGFRSEAQLVERYLEVVAARAAKRARSGGWGGGVWVGPARRKKEECVSWLCFPPAAALREVDIRPPGQRD
jgi:hypothetical protein